MTYLTTMYDAIRSTGATNLIFMQWRCGWEPNVGQTLSWASSITSAIGNPTNLAFTTHIYYYSPSDLTPYWDQNGVDAASGGVPMTTAQLQSTFSALISTMGVTAPLVFNEAGSCLAESATGTKRLRLVELCLRSFKHIGNRRMRILLCKRIR